ncbi:hypothetical protein BDQ17DRAFT_1420442 [Cyathus striatus]|nr:hypothetical protein BDQ17DRAFT_1420442 [Cyathus striatus]
MFLPQCLLSGSHKCEHLLPTSTSPQPLRPVPQVHAGRLVDGHINLSVICPPSSPSPSFSPQPQLPHPSFLSPQHRLTHHWYYSPTSTSLLLPPPPPHHRFDTSTTAMTSISPTSSLPPPLLPHLTTYLHFTVSHHHLTVSYHRLPSPPFTISQYKGNVLGRRGRGIHEFALRVIVRATFASLF